MAGDLRDERRERIRVQERAELAAHVHDSVLQTLALIRKAADDPREVSRLARTQERELRTWLYAPAGAPVDLTLSGALEQAAAEVEEDHGIAVEVVTVGDCPTGPRVTALVAAAREALVNAAKHAGVETVQVYAEVGGERVEVFVKDRGGGFDPRRCRPTGTAWRSRWSGAWSATAAAPSSAPRRGRAPRSGWRCPSRERRLRAVPREDERACRLPERASEVWP
jgi:signal transduction histidine kinase